jgi:hypothetical protein
MIDMAKYLLELQQDQMRLHAMLAELRAALEPPEPADGKASTPKELGPSVRLMHQAYVSILEDALSTANSLTDYLTGDGDRQ